jgi:DNA polymerase
VSGERDELAGIAHGLRRYLERERSGGTGELLADGAARAPRSAAPGAAAVAPGASVVAPRASAVAAPGASVAAPGDSLASTDLFGEPAPPPRPAPVSPPAPRSDAASLTTVFDDDLHPGGLEARAPIHATAVPVLEGIAKEIEICKRCGLHETRTRAVPGVGTARSGIVFVGEAPGADEDRKGEPFVGRAGQLLDRIIQAMDDAKLIPGVPLNRDTVYICNVLKSRPPENRNPLPHEVEACAPFLRRQLEALRPRVICCLGKFAAELLCSVKGSIAGLRGKVYRYQGAKLIVTYHPAFLLRSPTYKRPVWEDMQLVAREYLTD